MYPTHRSVAAFAVIAAVLLSLSGCARAPESSSAKTEPFKMELIDEAAGLNRLTLEAKAADRLGIETAPVGPAAGAGGETASSTVPYGAVLYDAKGTAFVYTNPQPLVFVRQPVTVEHVEGDLVTLSEGPPMETAVVTVGATELQGIEFGVGK